MTATTDLIALHLGWNLEIAQMTLADMSDAELVQRPVPTANHALWQLGHVAVSEAKELAALIPGVTACSESFASRFTKESQGLNATSDFPSKDEILAELTRVRTAVIAGVKQLTDEQLIQPSPVPWAKNVGQLVLAFSEHLTMHLGQVQVLRRKLGKPVLF